MVRTGGMPRVCLLTETFFPVFGGGENQARLLAGRLARQGMSVFVLTRRVSASLPSDERVDGVAVHRVAPHGFVRYGKYLMMAPAFIKLIMLRRSYDVIYVCGFRTLGVVAVLAGKLLGKPVILKAEADGEFSGSFVLEDRRLRQRQWLRIVVSPLLQARQAMLRSADAFVSISGRIREELLAGGVEAAAIHTIPNGLDLVGFQPASALQRATSRRRLGIEDDRVVVAYTGKLNRYKGLEQLVAVWRDVAVRYPKALLMLIGSGEGQFLSCERELKQFVEEHKLSSAVRFTGFAADVSTYLAACDGYVFPSEREGFPLGPFEAMACGLPVVASRVGAIPDVIDGVSTGLLVEPQDADGLRDGLYRLIGRRDEAARIAANGRRAIERFHIERIAQEYVALFARLVDQARTRVINCRTPRCRRLGHLAGPTRQDM